MLHESPIRANLKARITLTRIVRAVLGSELETGSGCIRLGVETDDIGLTDLQWVVKCRGALSRVIVVTILRVVKHKAVVTVVSLTLVTDGRG